jgi:putative DNA primase/helicase
MTGPQDPHHNRAPLPPINFKALADALLARADSLVPAWLPGGVRRGPEWVCGSLDGEPGSSCCVNLVTGQWGDFASDDKGGDLISLYAAMHGLDMGKAAVQVARDEGLEDVAGVQRNAAHERPERPPAPPPKAKAPRSDEKWATVRPVPAHAPEPTFKHYHRKPSELVRASEYRVGSDLHGYVVRFQTSDGGKDDLPYTWTTSERDGASKWNWKQFDEPRPLYLPGLALPGNRTVVLVEGERKAQVLQALLDAGAPGVYCVASWPGGCKAWQKADWSWLAGCAVLAWPDCDSKREAPTAKERNACEDDAALQALKDSKPFLPANKQPGMAAMLGIGALLRDVHGCTVQLLAIEGPGIKPDGWDAADAIEADGWDFDRVLAFFATAYALPSSEGAQPEAAAKKIDGPVDTEGGDFPDGASAADDGISIPDMDMPWWLKPYWDKDKKRWNISRKTVIQALRHVPELNGVLGFNLLSNTMEARHNWPFPHGKKGEISGATDLLLGNWLSTHFKMSAISRQALMEAMETVAYENPWHPVQEWLGGLQWDGVSRIDKWLIHAIGETPDSLKSTPESPQLVDMVEYLTLVGRWWLLGAVNRVMKPGCKFDYCPVLEGKGGLFKSTMVQALAGADWYSDTPFEIGKGKESQEQVQGIWMYELGELSQMGKAEITAIKAFISAMVDRYRPAYGRVIEKHPRQCVLVGTTNENTYLRDRTGNRRFWPIPVRHAIRVAWILKNREQLFAEAYQLYLQGAVFIPTKDQEDRLCVPMQESRTPTSSGMGSIVNELTAFVTLSQLTKALEVDAGKSTAGLESQIRSWINQQGWVYGKKQIAGVRAHGWTRPKGWPPEEEQEAPSAPPPAPTTEGGEAQPGGLSAAAHYLAEEDDAPF